jgi:hypothetical protein
LSSEKEGIANKGANTTAFPPLILVAIWTTHSPSDEQPRCVSLLHQNEALVDDSGHCGGKPFDTKWNGIFGVGIKPVSATEATYS